MNRILLFIHLRLRWYILGKYSSVVFSTNRNTDESLTEECLLDSPEVLVGSIMENAELEKGSDQYVIATNNEMKLLNEFELEVKKIIITIDYYLHIFS